MMKKSRMWKRPKPMASTASSTVKVAPPAANRESPQTSRTLQVDLKVASPQPHSELTLAALLGLRLLLQLHLLQLDGAHQLSLHAVSHPGTQTVSTDCQPKLP